MSLRYVCNRPHHFWSIYASLLAEVTVGFSVHTWETCITRPIKSFRVCVLSLRQYPGVQQIDDCSIEISRIERLVPRTNCDFIARSMVLAILVQVIHPLDFAWRHRYPYHILYIVICICLLIFIFIFGLRSQLIVRHEDRIRCDEAFTRISLCKQIHS